MERKEFEKKWKKSGGPFSRKTVYIGNKGGYVIANDYVILENAVSFCIDGLEETDILFGEFTLEDISDVTELVD